jgi:5-methylthioadenosine/S-adenosylhomocysteine deaminase
MDAPQFDLILKGTTLVTCNASDQVIEGGALGVKGGRLTYIGPEGKLPPASSAARVMDLQGRVVTPGFVNVHTHAILTMVRGIAEDLGFAPAYTPGIPHGHDVTPEEAVALARLGALEALLFGSTLINDTYVHADATLGAMAELNLRVYSCGRIHDADFSLIGEGRWEYHDAIGEKTLKEALMLAEKWHGKLNGRVGVQLAAHAPDTCSDRLLCRIREASEAYGLRVNTHLSQSKKENEQVRVRSGKTPAELLDDVGLLNHHLTAAHCIYITDSDIVRLGHSGMTVAHVPKGNATGGAIAPTTKLRTTGTHIALGTDNMHADMVEVMRWALAVGRVQEGKVGDFWQPNHVLRMATINGARAMGLDHELGSLEVGKKADFVVFNFRRPHLTPCIHPMANLVHVAQGRDVEIVAVDGQIVVEDGEPVYASSETIMKEAKKATDALWARARG